MKSFFYVAIVFIFSHSSPAQDAIYINVDPSPPLVGAPLEIVVHTVWWNNSGPAHHGSQLAVQGNQILYEVYFDYRVPVFGGPGGFWDTLNVPVLDANIDKIVVITYEVGGPYNGPPDTIGVDQTDTLFFSKINVPQYSTTQGFEFYPNPAKDKITIKVSGDAQVQKLILFDIAGRPILKRETFNTENPLELPGLAEGVYILRFEKDGVVFRERILVRP